MIKNGILAIIIGAILVFLAYQYVDKPVAIWMYQNHIAQYVVLKWFAYLPEFLLLAAMLIYIIFVIRFSYGLTKYFDHAMLMTANSVVIASFIKDLLKAIFGRYWPETWICKNLSLIQNNAYGFNFFHGGFANKSFPSGHITVTVAAMMSLWLLYPKFRRLYGILVILVMVGMVGMDYHFVGDVIGGALVGGLTAYYVVKIGCMKNPP